MAKEYKLSHIICPVHNKPKRISPKGALYCYDCRKDYVNRNRETVREKAAAIRERTREKNVLYQREYRDKHRQELLDKKKQKYRDTHVMVPVSKYGHVTKHPEYAIWSHMKSRCMTSSNASYSRYGGRGIFVCDRWKESFDNFLDDMGPRPEPRELYSIDRIDNNDGYYKENCRWTTTDVQNNNRRRRIDSVEGQKEIRAIINTPNTTLDTAAKFYSEKYGIDYKVCKYRFNRIPKESYVCSQIIDERNYVYEGNRYNIQELAIIAHSTYKVVIDLIRAGQMSIDEMISYLQQRRS